MTACVCGHDTVEHRNGEAHCSGISYDAHYDTQWACVCPRYREDM
jgi:hypothetical protein